MSEKHEAIALSDELSSAVRVYQQVSEDEAGGYCSPEDEMMDRAAEMLRRIPSIEAARQSAVLNWEKTESLLATVRRERDELKADYAESEAIRKKLADLLHRTAIALRGPEPELTRWSLHDLPELAAEVVSARNAALAQAEHYMAERNNARLYAQREVGKEVRKLRAELKQARDALRLVQWSGGSMDRIGACPCCGCVEDEGHIPFCELANALAANVKGE